VSEFAKLSPIQLLEETEKAIGDPDLPVQHRQLVERSKELKALEVVTGKAESCSFCLCFSEIFEASLTFSETLC